MSKKVKENSAAKNIYDSMPRMEQSSKHQSQDEQLRKDALKHELDQRNAILKNLFKVFKK